MNTVNPVNRGPKVHRSRVMGGLPSAVFALDLSTSLFTSHYSTDPIAGYFRFRYRGRVPAGGGRRPRFLSFPCVGLSRSGTASGESRPHSRWVRLTEAFSSYDQSGHFTDCGAAGQHRARSQSRKHSNGTRLGDLTERAFGIFFAGLFSVLRDPD